MKNTQKGGIETVIAVIILVGIVVALIISAVLPTVNEADKLSGTSVSKLSDLGETMVP